jgi:hypothetical protein
MKEKTEKAINEVILVEELDIAKRIAAGKTFVFREKATAKQFADLLKTYYYPTNEVDGKGKVIGTVYCVPK